MSHSRMIRRGVAAGGIALATLAVGACTSQPPAPVKPRLIPPARVVACSPVAGATVTMIEGRPLGCDMQHGQHLNVRMLPTVIDGRTWIVRCLDMGGEPVAGPNAPDFTCDDVGF